MSCQHSARYERIDPHTTTKFTSAIGDSAGKWITQHAFLPTHSPSKVRQMQENMGVTKFEPAGVAWASMRASPAGMLCHPRNFAIAIYFYIS